MVQLLPAASDLGQRLTVTNSLELPPLTMAISGLLMVMAALPVLVMVTVLVMMLPR